MPCVQFLLGKVRGFKKQIDNVDDIIKPIQSFANFARYYSKYNNKAKYALDEVEINPMVVSNNHLSALDGVVRVKANKSFNENEQLLTVYETSKPLYKLAYLFGASKICIVGASAKNAANPGTVILNKYLSIPKELRPELCCIHPKQKDMLGEKCYASLDDMLKEFTPDLIILGTPAAATAEYIKEIIEKNACKVVFTLAGGFGETE